MKYAFRIIRIPSLVLIAALQLAATSHTASSQLAIGQLASQEDERGTEVHSVSQPAQSVIAGAGQLATTSKPSDETDELDSEIRFRGLTESELRAALSSVEREKRRREELKKWVQIGDRWVRLQDERRVPNRTVFDRIHPLLLTGLLLVAVGAFMAWSANEVEIQGWPSGPDDQNSKGS